MRRSSGFPRSARRTTAALTGALLLTGTLFAGNAAAVGEGPDYQGNETVNTSILSTYDDVAGFLKDQDAKQDAMELEVIGQTVKGRDIHLAKYMSDPDNPTILYLAQQHGNEQLTTEAMLHTIKSLASKHNAALLDDVNVLFIPMFNADGAMGDVNFPLDGYLAKGERHLTRYNANEVDLNRDHVAKEQPETKALHQNVLRAYDIDYAIDLHHQGTQSRVNGDLVSGSILHPTTPDVSPELVERSKRLGSVVYENVDSTGWGHIGRYAGGTANTIGRNGIAAEYGIATLLFEMRGMSDHEYEPYVLGQKSNGYLIRQSVLTMEATIRSIADGSVDRADTSFWDTLPEQCSTC
ncbi:M14 family zinc carboxypeptidase [Streptomyces cavernicola]|uniref:M14 family zinc carboxypeptidase n=1 Tax=Streptomyces cavernicola TaxID=3043613 RepID=A0ABT6S969_9ACTN|nr:M14 family zinc carboxypeptidase [Streptomyces sp. B-S-A6]MDI3404652.1 M14 family zinc carboxypeptidase [Streptomyces sp. B-S-A6]